MECIRFDHELACEVQHIQQVAQVVLHTICFHRLLGTVKPAYIEAFGMTFPAIADAEVDLLIRTRAKQLVALLDLSSNSGSNKVELIVHFSAATPSLPTTAAGKAAEDSKPGGARVGDKASSMVHTAAHAASSLRAWASPRSYQYGWLAQAFSGGAGQPSGTFIPPRSPDAPMTQEKQDMAQTENEAFETWAITFQLRARREQDAQRASVSADMERFVQRVLLFVEKNKSHLPPITSADLSPYPMRIVVRPVS